MLPCSWFGQQPAVACQFSGRLKIQWALALYAKELHENAADSQTGRWNPGKRLWFVKYGKIAGTPLEKHIHVDEK